MINLAPFIKSRRQNIGLTQKQLAKLIGVTDVTISRWESGQRDPIWYQFVKLCEVLGMDPNWFMYEIEENTTANSITVGKLNFDNVMTYDEFEKNKENKNDE